MTTLCACGCGEPVSIRRGKPMCFAGPGHWLRTPEGKAQLLEYRWKGEKAGLSPLHKWLRKNFTKTGTCEHCHAEKGTTGRGRGTEWAFLWHPEPYTRNREDYWELCRRCHVTLDYAIGYRSREKRTTT